MTATWTGTVNRSVGQAVSSSDLNTYIGVNGNLDYLKNSALAGTVTQSADLAGAGRVLGTTYQNTNTTAMFVTVVYSGVAGATAYAQVRAYRSASTPPVTVISDFMAPSNSSTGGYAQCSFWVKPNWYYQVTNQSGATLNHWYEDVLS